MNDAVVVAIVLAVDNKQPPVAVVLAGVVGGGDSDR